jgi:squalene-hopene/tetraprenyl-beta-curcumene cyclase
MRSGIPNGQHRVGRLTRQRASAHVVGMRSLPFALVAAAACLAATRYAPATHSPSVAPASWNARAAAAYLDRRMAWWLAWPTAARDHGTACVSCHTALPYALARPALRAALAETTHPDPERALIENVVKRVWLWKEVDPFYPDQTRGLPKTSESRGTEAVLNALILSGRDAERGSMSDDSKQAFANLWALQFRNGDQKGAWAWLNFHNEPWEANGSPYFGAALAAIAVGRAPGGYAATPEIREHLTLLEDYLRRGADSAHLLNRAMVLWASGELPGLLAPEQRQSIVDAALSQQHEDGGWSTASLGPWKRGDGTPLDAASDGYATGLIVLALQHAGLSPADGRVSKGFAWLTTHQDAATGMWTASSLNRSRDPSTDIGKFMSDAATAYAVMALTSSNERR